jgi:hypothetical protein
MTHNQRSRTPGRASPYASIGATHRLCAQRGNGSRSFDSGGGETEIPRVSPRFDGRKVEGQEALFVTLLG